MRQIDDLRDIPELEAQLDNAFGVILMIESEMKMARAAIATQDPFKLMAALAEANKLIVREAMPTAIIAQDEYLKPIKADAARIA